MADKKKKRYGERMMNAGNAMRTIGWLFLGLGAFGFVYAGAAGQAYLDMRDVDYMTDPSISYRDVENATYEYEWDDIDEKVQGAGYLLLFAFMPLVVGVVLVYADLLMPDRKAYHKSECKGEGEAKYCAECGLKLSELKKGR